MENEMGERERGQLTPSCIPLNGWVDWDRKMETMMGSADARKRVDGTMTSLPPHRRAVLDEEVTYSVLNEMVHHLKIMIRIKVRVR